MVRTRARAAGAPPLAELRAALAAYDRTEELFRAAVSLERVDDERRRSSRRSEIARPAATPGDAERYGRALEQQLPELSALVRAGIAATSRPSTRPAVAVSALAVALDTHTVEQLRSLAEDGWRDPWAGGQHGPPSRFDPRRPGA